MLVFAGPTDASTFVVRTPRDDDGIATLATPHALYTIRDADAHLVRTDPRGVRRSLRQFDGLLRAGRALAGSEEQVTYDLAVSARWLAVAQQRISRAFDCCTYAGAVLQVARRSGKARTVLDCRADAPTELLALRGSMLAYSACGGASTIVRDLDQPSRIAQIAFRATAARFAGTRVVLSRDAGPYDWGAPGLEVHDVAGGRLVLAAGPDVSATATREDGTVVLIHTENNPAGCSASVLDPGATSPRALPAGLCPYSLAGALGLQYERRSGADGLGAAVVTLDGHGPPRSLHLGVWDEAEFVPGGRVALFDEDVCANATAYAFVPVSALLHRAPAPPRCHGELPRRAPS